MPSKPEEKSNCRKSIWTCKSRQNKRKNLPRIRWSQFSTSRWPISWMFTTRRKRNFINLNPSSASKTIHTGWMKWANCKTSVKRRRTKTISSTCISSKMLLSKTRCQLTGSSRWMINVVQIFELCIRRTSLSKSKDRTWAKGSIESWRSNHLKRVLHSRTRSKGRSTLNILKDRRRIRSGRNVLLMWQHALRRPKLMRRRS